MTLFLSCAEQIAQGMVKKFNLHVFISFEIIKCNIFNFLLKKKENKEYENTTKK
jgi:hypothetical protein